MAGVLLLFVWLGVFFLVFVWIVDFPLFKMAGAGRKKTGSGRRNDLTRVDFSGFLFVGRHRGTSTFVNKGIKSLRSDNTKLNAKLMFFLYF